MGWVSLLDRNSVSIGISAPKQGGKSYKVCSISLSNSLASSLKWKKGDRVKIELGTDKDKGYIRLEKVTETYNSYKLIATGNSNISIRTHKLISPADSIQPATKCVYEVKGKYMIVKLPEYFSS
jgi:hypothetical protein